MNREEFWCNVFLSILDRRDATIEYKDCLYWADYTLEDYDKRFPWHRPVEMEPTEKS